MQLNKFAMKGTHKGPHTLEVNSELKSDLARSRQASRQYVDNWETFLSKMYPNTTMRQENEDLLQQTALDSLIKEFESNDTDFYKHLMFVFELCCNLSSREAGKKVARNLVEMTFIATVLSHVYLRDENYQRRIVDKLAFATSKQTWFHVPKEDHSMQYPHWLHKCRRSSQTSVATFETTLHEWNKISPRPLAKEVHTTSISNVAEALLMKLVHDGEFYFLFLVAVLQQCQQQIQGPRDWLKSVPEYERLIYIGLRLVHEAAFETWQLRDVSFTIPEGKEFFALAVPRSVKTVMQQSCWLLKTAPDLSYICILALFEVTNVNNSKSVGTCLSQLEDWLRQLTELNLDVAAMTIRGATQRSSSLSSLQQQEFSWITAIKILLKHDHYEILKRTLLFVYNILGMIVSDDIRTRMLKVLIRRHFSLFLHWHSDVRNYYHHILVYKIMPSTHRLRLYSHSDRLLIKYSDFNDSNEWPLPLHCDDDDHPNNVSMDGLFTMDAFVFESRRSRYYHAHHYPIEDKTHPHDMNHHGDHPDESPVMEAAPSPRTSHDQDHHHVHHLCWAYLDAGVALLCLRERERAHDANFAHKIDCTFAEASVTALANLKAYSAEDFSNLPQHQRADGRLPTSSSSSTTMGSDVDAVLAMQRERMVKLKMSPPYMRVLPEDEEEALLSLVDRFYPDRVETYVDPKAWVYARLSLRQYIEVLQTYYKQCRHAATTTPEMNNSQLSRRRNRRCSMNNNTALQVPAAPLLMFP